jgi:hypothetical protein
MARRAGKGGIVVDIGTSYDDRGMRRAQNDVRQFGNTAKGATGPMSKFGSTMQTAVGKNLMSVQSAAAGALAGLGAFVGMMAVDGIQSAAAEEQQLARLRSALDNVNQGFALDSITAFIDKLMYATNVVDDELRPAFQTLVTATRDAKQAQDLLTLAVDISVAKNKDLGTVTTALARAANGSTTALGRLAPGLSENAREAGNFGIAVAELQTLFGGAAAANVDTFAGRLKNLQIVFDETKEAFGTGFLEGIEESLAGLGSISDAAVGLQPTFEELGRTIGETAGEIITLVDQLVQIREAAGIFGEIINPISSAAGTLAILGDALGIVAGKLGLNVVPSARDAANNLQVMGRTDFTYLRQQLGLVSSAADEAARPRTLSIVLQTRFEAGQVGMSPDLTRILNDYFESQIDDTVDAAADVKVTPPRDPFKEWTASLSEQSRVLATRVKLVAAGIPAVMADSILSSPDWRRIVKGVLAAGRQGVDAYVSQWLRAPDGVAAIADRVEAIVDVADQRLERIRDRADEFRDVQRQFADIAADFGKVTTVDADLPLTGVTITDNLRQRLAAVKQFAASLAELRDKGLGPSALADVIRLGPFEGLQYARAILEGGQVTIDTISNLSSQFQTPADVIGRIGAEAVTGTTLSQIQAGATFQVQAGAVQITVNGEVSATVRQQITDAVTDAFSQVGREARTRGRAGVR